MANAATAKLGCWNLRCDEAVLSAMLIHPRHGKERRFVGRGVEMVEQGNWAFAVHLPRKAAHDALIGLASAIARKQQRSGLWSRSESDPLSFAILHALAYAKLLAPLRADGRLRYDPVQPFAARQDFYGLMVRSGIMHKPLPNDPLLRKEFQEQCLKQQKTDGSWGGVVSETALSIERLLDLGLRPAHPMLKRAAAWMLGQCRNVELPRGKATCSFQVKDVLTTESRSEFTRARELLPHRKLVGVCFLAVPFVPTALALRALVRLGLHRDARVKRAYDSLLDMEVHEGEHAFGRALSPGWCGFKCRFKLEARSCNQLPHR
jgi:hypothetical protein